MQEESDFMMNPDKAEHPLWRIYPLCIKIYNLFERNGKAELFVNSDIIERLNVNKDAEGEKKAYACRTIANIMAVLLVSLVLTVILIVKQANGRVIDEGCLARAEVGEGLREYDLTAVDLGTGEEVQLTVPVSEQRCADEELDSFFDTAFEAILPLVLGEGISADYVTGNLNLIKKIPGTSIDVSWPEPDHTYIFSDGTVRYDAIAEPTVISLTVRLQYFDEVRLYAFPIRLIPRPEETEQSFKDRLITMLNEEDRSSGKTSRFRLPTQVGDTEVRWKEQHDGTVLWIPVLGIIAALAMIPGTREELAGKNKLRTEQMMRDYPELISKFILLIGAGTTCRGAWEKICRDYRKKCPAAGNRSSRFAYEEMLRSQRDLNLGISEARVYEEFGRRSGVPAYRRLGTLLANNLRRGSRDIINMLEQESREAFAERKNAVQMKAEEAGTKLLFPMLGMLALVIAIVVVPAFASFAG